jgi:hypothetical protein
VERFDASVVVAIALAAHAVPSSCIFSAVVGTHGKRIGYPDLNDEEPYLWAADGYKPGAAKSVVTAKIKLTRNTK